MAKVSKRLKALRSSVEAKVQMPMPLKKLVLMLSALKIWPPKSKQVI